MARADDDAARNEPPAPETTYQLLGHEAAETEIAAAIESGRLHHAWLIAGPRGVGKATLAYRVARRVLGARPDPSLGPLGSSRDDPVCQRIEAGSNADLRVVTRGWDDKRARLRTEITIDEIRKLKGFFATTAASGGWRVAIVDPADEMNVNAANAILKTLEEPPSRAVLLLVAHAPGRLPATIRSRCRLLRLSTPPAEVAVSVTRQALGLSADDARAAASLADGRPGEAVRIAVADGAAISADIAALIEQTGSFDRERARALADRLNRTEAGASRELFFRFLRDQARAAAKARAGEAATAWLDAWSEIGALERDLDAINLNAKLVVLEALTRAHDAARRAEAV